MGPKAEPEELLTILLEDLGVQQQISRLHLYLLQEVMSGNEELLARYTDRYREWQEIMKSFLTTLFGEGHPAHTAASAVLMTFIEGNTMRGTVLSEAAPYREMAKCITHLYA